MFSYCILFVFIAYVTSVYGVATPIKSLPGWKGSLPSHWYSGLVDTSPSPAGTKMFTHYVFVESETNKANAPVIIWMNGGPGASSMFGLLVELGPLQLNDASMLDPVYNSTGIPQLIYNEFSWSKFAHLLIIDFPPPVGFSFCNPPGPAGGGPSCGAWNDTSTTIANHRAIKAVLTQELPQYLSNELYIIGESYAGIYVPMLAEALRKDQSTHFNLRGIGVGDGCQGTDVLCGSGSGPLKRGGGPWYDLLFMYGHGQMSNALYNAIRKQCPESELRHGGLNTICQTLVKKAEANYGKFYAYNLYDNCHDNIFKNSKHLHKMGNLHWGRTVPFSAHTGYYCPGQSMEMWLNRADVRKALNVPVNSNFFSEDNGNGFTYIPTQKNVLPIYIDYMTKYNIRTLVYNGDTDPAINSFVTQDIFFDYFADNNMAMTEEWRPWSHTANASYTMGYVQEYAGNFRYVTHRGSGHMVPQFVPAGSFFAIKSFVENTPLPQN